MPTSPPRILMVEDDSSFAATVREELLRRGVKSTLVGSLLEARAVLASAPAFACALVEHRLPDGDGLSLIDDIHASNPTTKVILVTGHPALEEAMGSLRKRLHDYFIKPVDGSALIDSIVEAAGVVRNPAVDTSVNAYPSTVAALLSAASAAAVSTLLVGETGTGKSYFARRIHDGSDRRGKPFVSVNCAAIPENLFESELFGVERGAFTGAATRPGLIEEAHGGTLFLDEIGEMPRATQVKLLAFLEDRLVRRVGATATRPIDVRIIAATNADIDGACASGSFRTDLYFRIVVLRIDVPPLRDRPDELGAIIDRLLPTISATRGRGLAPGELDRMRAYPWPGNVRELRNILERTPLLQEDDELRPSLLLRTLKTGQSPSIAKPDSAPAGTLSDLERERILITLRQQKGNKEQTARSLGISLSTLKRRLRTYSDSDGSI